MTDEQPTGRSPFRVRFDECGPDGRLRTSVLLRYAQDLAGFHSALMGIDRAWYAARGIGWLVRAAHLGIDAPIGVGDVLEGATRAAGFRRVWARRRSEFRDAAGLLVAWADIDWVLLDGRGAPTRIPPEFNEAFRPPPATVDIGRVALPDAPADAFRSSFRVRPQELDPMDHVNNAAYADWLDEAVIAAGAEAAVRSVPRRLRLDYARSAERDDVVATAAWPDPDGTGWSVRITDEAGDLLRARLEPGEGARLGDPS